MRRGYAAARAARALPFASRPCATSPCPRVPWVHCAISSSRNPARMPRAHATVVYLRAAAPSAHCANVTNSAPALARASRTTGSSQIGAWSANRPHHASPPSSPQSAGFSSAHG
eukprot:1221444-Pleurochrysis_carterae.AAC.1